MLRTLHGGIVSARYELCEGRIIRRHLHPIPPSGYCCMCFFLRLVARTLLSLFVTVLSFKQCLVEHEAMRATVRISAPHRPRMRCGKRYQVPVV